MKKTLAIIMTFAMLFSLAAVFTVSADEVSTLEISPVFGCIENWPADGTETYFITKVVTPDGQNNAFFSKVKEGSYSLRVSIADETAGKTYVIDSYAFDTPAREFYMDGEFCFFRFAPCQYGIPVTLGSSYTVKVEAFDGATLIAAGTSATGAFASFNELFQTMGGAVVPDEVPHTSTVLDGIFPDTPVVPEPPVEEGPKSIEASAYGDGWENWSDQTQLLIIAPFDSKEAGATEYTWKITLGDKTIELVPSSVYDYGDGSAIWRFETCLGEGENQFVPVAGESYVISAEVYSGDELVYEVTAKEGASWNVPAGFQPILPDPVDPPQTGDATVYAIVFAVVAIMGMAVVVTKKVNA